MAGAMYYAVSDPLCGVAWQGEWEACHRVDVDEALEMAALARATSGEKELPCLVRGGRILVGAAAIRGKGNDWEKWARDARDECIEPLRRQTQVGPLRRWTRDAPELLRPPGTWAVFSNEARADESAVDPSTRRTSVSQLARDLWDRISAIESALDDRSQSVPEPLFVVPVAALAAVYSQRLLFSSSSFSSPADQLLDDDNGVDERFTSETMRPKWHEVLRARGREKVAEWTEKACAEDEALGRFVADLVLAHEVPTGRTPKLDARFGYNYAEYQGVTQSPFIRPDVLAHLASNFETRANDVFVVTYPKCGTTLTQALVLLLLNGGNASEVLPHPELQTQAPWLEACYVRTRRFGGPCPYLDSLQCHRLQTHGGRRVFKSHAPVGLAPGSVFFRRNQAGGPRCKYIYVARNAKDCAQSLFSQCVALPKYEYTGDIEHFVRTMFLPGRVGSGSWLDHVLGWWRASLTDPVAILFVFFEDLLTNPRAQLERISDFLQIGPLQPSLADAVLRASSFNSMKARATSAMPEAASRFRAGKAGKWRVADGGQLTDQLANDIDATFLSKLPPDFLTAAPDPYYLPYHSPHPHSSSSS